MAAGLRGFEEVLTGVPAARRPQFPGVFAAEVSRSDADELWFVIPSFNPHVEFGPVVHAAAAPPAVGSAVTVAFEDGDANLPRVLVLGVPGTAPPPGAHLHDDRYPTDAEAQAMVDAHAALAAPHVRQIDGSAITNAAGPGLAAWNTTGIVTAIVTAANGFPVTGLLMSVRHETGRLMQLLRDQANPGVWWVRGASGGATWAPWQQLLTGDAHGNSGDPHTQYALESSLAQPLGIATLDALGRLPAGQLTTHTHDDRYFTEAEADGRFATIGHAHAAEGGGRATLIADAVVQNSVAEVVLLSYVIPANSLVAGAVYVFELAGNTDNRAVVDTCSLRVRVGGIATAMCNIVTPAVAQATKAFYFRGLFVCRAAGAGGSGRSSCQLVTNAPTAGADKTSADNSVVSALNTTGALTLELTAQWSVANAANILRAFNGVIALERAA